MCTVGAWKKDNQSERWWGWPKNRQQCGKVQKMYRAASFFWLWWHDDSEKSGYIDLKHFQAVQSHLIIWLHLLVRDISMRPSNIHLRLRIPMIWVGNWLFTFHLTPFAKTDIKMHLLTFPASDMLFTIIHLPLHVCCCQDWLIRQSTCLYFSPRR